MSELKLHKKLSLPKQEREEEIQNPPKDDIMNRVVNHAHQRNPNKKW
ncbi:transcriptional regulator [Providencia stuartii]|nr:transcriptional regulator [Providencia stuartii]